MKTVLGLMLVFVTCAVAAEPLAQPASGLATPPAAESIFAIINGKRVFVRDYDALFATVLRQRFYHGKIPEGQAEAVQKEVADLLIDRELLVAEATRIGLKPEAGKFEQMLAAYDARYAAVPEWQQRRAQLLPEIKEQVERQSLIEQYEKSVRNVPRPTVKEARAYYEQNPALFTQPEKLRLSVILLKVDPAAPKEIWEKARVEAQAIYARIKAGAAFAEQARQHSKHESAIRGGDLGYLHGGMLTEALQSAVNKFVVGVVNEPLITLEGAAIYQLEERAPAKLQDFAAVQARAQDLLERDKAEQLWRKTLDRLRAAAKIEMVQPITK